jgi:lysophospholipase L1-like esterase
VSKTIAAVLVGALLTLPGCLAHRAKALPASPRGPAIVFAAIGGSETVGDGTDNPVRDAWPQVLFRTALPASAMFVNFAIPGVTVSTAVDGELPEVLQIQPTLVAVWLNVTDVLNGVSARTYESQLRSLLAPLRAAGATVLVANTPPVTDLPAYAACADPASDPSLCPPGVAQPVPSPAAMDATIGTYNAAIARVAAEVGAVVVDLHAADLRARAAGQEAALISSDGLDPSAAGAAFVAEQFAAALRTTTVAIARRQ